MVAYTAHGVAEVLPPPCVEAVNVEVGDATPWDVATVGFNATSFGVTSPTLTELDARNTSSVRNNVDLLGCPRLRTCLFAGSGAAGLLLPVGAKLTLVSFPSGATTVFMHSLPFLTNAGVTLPTLAGITTLYINNCPNIAPFAIAEQIIQSTGEQLAYATLIWNGIVQGNVDTILALSERSGEVVFDGSSVTTQGGKPHIEGTVQVPGVYQDYMTSLDIVSEETYGTNLKKALSNLFGTTLYIIYNINNIFINFADDAFKAICLANWDTNGDGKFSVSEAAAVSNNNFSSVAISSLHNNANIVSLYDLKYFTNVNILNVTGGSGSSTYGPISYMSNLTTIAFGRNFTIPAYNLKRCPKLRTWYFGGTLTASANQIFTSNPGLFGDVYLTDMAHWYGSAINSSAYTGYTVNCRLYLNNVELTTIDFPTNINTVRSLCFARCTRITSINLPANVTNINTYAFYYCSGMTTLVVRATTPPSLANTNAFTGKNANLKIYVPYSSDQSIIDAYKAATNWSSFASIIYELDENGNIPT